MTRDSWLLDRVREFERLRGRQVTSWSGVQMALREEAGAGGSPQFEDPAVPCLQMSVLRIVLADAASVAVGTYQDDEFCGLWLRESVSDPATEWNGIFRSRALPELPVGEVDDVSVVVDEAVLAEVVVRIGGRPLLLMAGEVYEDPGGVLSLVRLDESVLVFTDPPAAESVNWLPARGPQPGVSSSR